MDRLRRTKPTSGSKKTDEEESRSKNKKVKSFLESSFRACTSDCIEVETESLKKFFETDEGASSALSAALDFNKFRSIRVPAASWKSWGCCFCTNCYADSVSHNLHVFKNHVDQPSSDVTNFLRDFAQHFPEEWYQSIFAGSWKPIDLSSGAVPDSDASLAWADTEKEILLGSIAMHFRMLLRSRVLHTSHVQAMLDYAMATLKVNGAERNSFIWLRCLGAPQLKHVKNFLCKLWRACKLDPQASSFTEDNDDDEFLDPNSKVMLVLDESRSIITIYGYDWFIPCDNGNDVSYNLDSAAVISWLYDDDINVEHAVNLWKLLERARNERCARVIQGYMIKQEELRGLCGQRTDWMRYKEALQDLVIIQNFEKVRLENADSTIRSFKEVLKGWEELLSEDMLDVFTDAASKILTEAEDIKTSGNCDDGNFITKALMKDQDELTMKLHVNAAKILKTYNDISLLGKQFGKVSCLDYLVFMIPMVKTFLRAKWESDAGQVRGVGSLGKWSGLPSDVLSLLCDRLSVPQLLRLGTVCHSWHSVVVHYTPYQRRALAPWLVFTHKEPAFSCTVKFLDLEEKRYYSIELPVDPEARGRRYCLGSAFGWLVAIHDVNYHLYLVNPISHRRIPLPRLLPSSTCDAVPHLQYEQGKGFMECRENVGLLFPRKAVLSSNPDDEGNIWTVVLTLNSRVRTWKMAFCRREDSMWTVVNVPEPIHDVIYFKDRVYALSADGGISTWSYSEGEGPQSVIIFSPSVPDAIRESLLIFRYLVPSPSGDLYQLWRGMLRTKEMFTKVFEVELKDQLLVERNTLNGLTVFAGLNAPICVPYKEFPKSDCVYFADRQFARKRLLEIYNLRDGSIEDILPLLEEKALCYFFQPC